MRLTYLFRLLLGICFILASNPLKATHLMGGHVSYRYLSFDSVNQTQNYEIKFYIFRDCSPGTAYLSSTVQFSVVSLDDSSFFSGNAKLDSNKFTIVSPDTSGNCVLGALANYCVQQGIYTDTITVPLNTNGYKIITQSCCRNNAILNMTPMSIEMSVIMKNIYVGNESANFVDVPVPFICNGVTTYWDMSAYDAEGDSLYYEMTDPLGLGTVYQSGFSSSAPLGSTGSISIDSITGIATVNIRRNGNYVVAFNIKEYRNGYLLSVIRRDVQFLVSPCPGNSPPTMVTGVQPPGATTISGQQNITVYPGDTVRIPLIFTDIDSVTFKTSGSIFNPVVAQNSTIAPYIDTIRVTRDSLFAMLIWQPNCTYWSNRPLTFNIQAKDNGCPKMSTIFGYYLNFVNVPLSIQRSPINHCLATKDSAQIIVNGQPANGLSYQWRLVNGLYQNGSTTSKLVFLPDTNQLKINPKLTVYYGCDVYAQSCLIQSFWDSTTYQLADIKLKSKSNDSLFCKSDFAFLTLDSSFSFSTRWFLNAASVRTNVYSASFSHNLLNSGLNSLKVLVTAQNGCSDTVRTNFYVRKHPAFQLQFPTSICLKDTFQFSVLPNLKNSLTNWFRPTTRLNDSTFRISNLSVGSQNFGAYLIDNYGCLDTLSAVVRVNPLPAVQPIVGPDSLCLRSTASFSSLHQSTSTNFWSGTFIGNSVQAASNRMVSLSFGSIGNHQIAVQTVDTNGCKSDSSFKSLFIRSGPVATFPADTSFCGNGSISLSLPRKSFYRYQWNGDASISSNTSDSIHLFFSNTTTSSIYKTIIGTVTDTSGGCSSSDSIQITIHPSIQINLSGPLKICSGELPRYSALTLPSYTYNWSGSNSNFVGSRNIQSLTNTPMLYNQLIDLKVVVRDTLTGCSSKDSLRVRVNETPVFNLPNDTSLCSGIVFQLSVPMRNNWTYQWNPAISATSSIQLNLVNRSNSVDTATIRLTIVDTSGCAASDSLKIAHWPLPTVFSTQSASICSGDSIRLGNPSVPRSSYEWRSPALIGSNNSNQALFSYINSSPNSIYLQIFHKETNLFGCADSSLFPLKVYPKSVTPTILGKDLVCRFDTAQFYQLTDSNARNSSWITQNGRLLTSTKTSAWVNWTPPSILYAITIDSNGCKRDTAKLVIRLAQSPDDIRIVGDSLFCELPNSPKWYQANRPLGTLNWQVFGGNILATNQNQVQIQWNQVNGAWLKCTETSSAGCLGNPDSLNLHLFENTLTIEKVTTRQMQPDSLELHWKVTQNYAPLGQQFALMVKYPTNPAYSLYGMYDRSQSIISLSKLKSSTPYSFQLQTANFCLNPVSSSQHENVVLTGNWADPTRYQLNWNAYQPWHQSVVYQVLKSQELSIPLQPISSVGNQLQYLDDWRENELINNYRIQTQKAGDTLTSYSNQLKIISPSSLFVPSAFSPDANQLNDVFKAVGAGIRTFEMRIFNRWGEEIFVSSDIQIGWDGTFKNIDCENGVYAYVITYVGADGKSGFRKGTVSLVR